MSPRGRWVAWGAALLTLATVPLANLPWGAWPAVFEGAVPLPWPSLAGATLGGLALWRRSGPQARSAEPASSGLELLAAGLLCALVELDQPWPVRAGVGRVLAAGGLSALVLGALGRRASGPATLLAAAGGVGWIVAGTVARLPEPEGSLARLRWGLGSASPEAPELLGAALLLALSLPSTRARRPLAIVAGVLAVGPLPLVASALGGPTGRACAIPLVAVSVALGSLGSHPLLRPAVPALALALLVRLWSRHASAGRRYPPDPPADGSASAAGES